MRGRPGGLSKAGVTGPFAVVLLAALPRGELELASPLFPHVTVALGTGRALVIDAPGAGATTPYVHALVVTGLAPGGGGCVTSSGAGPARYDCPWLPSSITRSGGQLGFTLGRSPDAAWGAAPSEAPLSFGAG